MFGGIPFNYAAKPDGDDEGLSVTSSQEELWSEVRELRTKLRLAEARADMALDAQTATGKPILILKGAHPDDSAVREIAKFWQTKSVLGSVIVLPANYKLEELDDEDLAKCGLKRVKLGLATERDEYDFMLQGN